jgi:hypothetical protein
MNLRLAVVLSLLGLAFIGSACPAEPVKAAKPKSPSEFLAADLLREQQALIQQFATIKQTLFKLKEHLAEGTAQELEQAKALDVVLKEIEQRRLEKLLSQLSDLLKRRSRDLKRQTLNSLETGGAMALSQRVLTELRGVRKQFVEDNLLLLVKEEKQEIAGQIKQLGQLIMAQKRLRDSTKTKRISLKKEGGHHKQSDVTQRTLQLSVRTEGVDDQSSKLMLQAADLMKYAAAALQDMKYHRALKRQDQALKALAAAKVQLDTVAKRLRTEEIVATLKHLQNLCKLMVERQKEVLVRTVALHKTIQDNKDKKPKPADLQKALRLAEKQKRIDTEAGRVIEILKVDGSAPGFLEVFKQVRSDIREVQNRLVKADTGELTEQILKDVIETLAEMAPVLNKAIIKLRPKSGMIKAAKPVAIDSRLGLHKPVETICKGQQQVLGMLEQHQMYLNNENPFKKKSK